MTLLQHIRSWLAPMGSVLLGLSLFTAFLSFWTAVPCLVAGMLLHGVANFCDGVWPTDAAADEDVAYLFV
jgi:hypothetical protein